MAQRLIRAAWPRACGALAALGLCAVLPACGGLDESAQGGQGLTVCGDDGGVLGIDVSHDDGTIDWSKVKASGRVFAFAKATEGVTFVDPAFATNWSGMKSAGVVRGAYHFFRPQDDGVAQANWMLKNLGTLDDTDLPPVLDVETTDNQPTSVVNAEIAAWLSAVASATGRTPIVYSSNRFWTQVLGNTSAPCDLWDANWGVACPNLPTPWSSWRFWQFSDTGVVSGVATKVDVDRFNGSLADLLAYVAASGGAADAGAADAGDLDAGDLDAGAADAGSPDAGIVLAQSGGGCGTSPGSSGSSAGLLCPLALALLWPLRRRRAHTSARSNSGASSARIIS